MDIRRYLNVIITRKWIVLQAVAVVTLVAVLGSVIQPRLYEGVSRVLITDKDVGAAIFGTQFSDFTGNSERGSQTQVEVVQSQPVLELAIEKLGIDTTPEILLEQIEVSAVGDTDVMEISAVDRDPEQAAAIANAIANAYVGWTKQSKRESIRAASSEVQTRMDEVKQQITDLAQEMRRSGRSDELEAEMAIATTKYSTLAQKLEELRVNEQLQVGSGKVMRLAVPNYHAVSPKLTRNILLGLVAGLGVGIGLAFLFDLLDNTLKSAEEVEALYRAPILGTIPVDKTAEDERRRLSIVHDPGGAVAEAYRVLRNNLDFVNFEHEVKALLVTSPEPSEGKSTVASNLAAALARAGATVILVNADFHRPVTSQLLPVHNNTGLSDVLMGTVGLEAAMQNPYNGSLFVVNSGKTPPNPSELLSSARMGELVRHLQELADWVIFDAPPLLAASDAIAMTRWADGVLMVARHGTSTRPSANAGREMLEKVGARTLGVVVWGLPQDFAVGGGYGSYSSFGSYTRTDSASAPEKKG